MSADDQLPLIQRIAAGDAAALQCLLIDNRPFLVGYAEKHLPRCLKGQIDAQDLVQDAAMEALRQMESFPATDMRSALLWLVQLCRGRIARLTRMHRAARRGGGRSAMNWPAEGEDSVVMLLADLAIYERTPSRSAAAHELWDVVRQSLLKLPEDYRRAIRLRYMQGLSAAQTAEQMGRTAGAIQMLLSRAIKALRTEMRTASLYL